MALVEPVTHAVLVSARGTILMAIPTPALSHVNLAKLLGRTRWAIRGLVPRISMIGSALWTFVVWLTPLTLLLGTRTR